jgi:iron complex transport system ATP-binding protein
VSVLLAAHGLTLQAATRTLTANLDLEVQPGHCWAVLGLNGAGKTSLLHTLAGLRAPARGSLFLDGTALQHQRRRAVARRIGLLPQDTPDPFPATVLETVLLGRSPFLAPWEMESAADRERARAALAAMELQDLEQRSVATLSGGERRRLAFALLLTQAPALWLLDEPTNHLDLRHQALVLQQVQHACANGVAAVMVLHDPNLAARYANNVLLLYDEGQWEAGPAEKMLTAERLSGLYGYPVLAFETAGRKVFVSG